MKQKIDEIKRLFNTGGTVRYKGDLGVLTKALKENNLLGKVKIKTQNQGGSIARHTISIANKTLAVGDTLVIVDWDGAILDEYEVKEIKWNRAIIKNDYEEVEVSKTLSYNAELKRHSTSKGFTAFCIK